MDSVALFNVVVPDTFNDDIHVDEPETTELKLVYVIMMLAFKLYIQNVDPDDNEFRLLNAVVVAFKFEFFFVWVFTNPGNLNIVIDVAFNFFIDNIDKVLYREFFLLIYCICCVQNVMATIN